MKPRHFYPFALLTLSLAGVQQAQAINYYWDGTTNANNSGNWSDGANWNPDFAGGPALAGAFAILVDVTTGTRTVTLDAAAPGGVSNLQFNQTTSGAVNELLLLRNLSSSNAITLATTAGTERITVGTTAAAAFVLTAPTTGGLNINAGGVLVMTATQNTAGTAYNIANIGSSVTNGGNTTVAGGTLTLTNSGSIAASTATNIWGLFAMSSGTISIENTGAVSDRRLQFNKNANITGGTISTTKVGAGGSLFFVGATNTFKPTTFDTDLTIQLSASVDQSFDSSVLLNDINVRGTGIKTISNSASSGNIGSISFTDANNAVANSATTLKLGSNLTLGTGRSVPSIASGGQSIEAGTGRVDVGIDSNGYTLDLTAGASAGVWTANASAATNTVWTLSDTAVTGAIKANAFDLSTAAVTTNVGAGVTLQAAGGNGTANDLGGPGTIDATSTFKYSGTAAVATPATLTSDRAIGKLEVTSGALNFGGTGAAASATVASGATLSGNSTFSGLVNVSTGGFLSPGNSPGNMTLNGGLTVAGTYTWELGALSTTNPATDFDTITITAGSADITGAALGLNLGAFAPSADPFWTTNQTWSGILNNTSLAGTLTGVFAAIDNTSWSSFGTFSNTYTSNDVNLVWTAVPEPTTSTLAGLLLTAGLLRRRRKA